MVDTCPRPRGQTWAPQGSRSRGLGGGSGACGHHRRSAGRHVRGQAPPTRCGGAARVGGRWGPPQGRAGSARHLLDCSVRCRTAEVNAPRPCGERAARRKAYSVLGLRSSTTNAVAGSKVLPTWRGGGGQRQGHRVVKETQKEQKRQMETQRQRRQ